MRVEAFSAGRDPKRPDLNEDRLVVLPGRAYAVIDGVTARVPTLFDGKLSGRYAADLLQAVLEREAGDAALDGAALVLRLTEAVSAAYRRFGMLDVVRDDPNPRFSATMALVLEREEHLEVVLVGDSGVRVNGSQVFQPLKDLDGITAALRAAAWPRVAARTSDPVRRERVTRQVTFHGTRQPVERCEGLLHAPDLLAVEADAMAACAARYPGVPEVLMAGLLRGGIVNEQRRHQNNGASPLGYSCLDGFPIPSHLVETHRLPLREVGSIELFTDGYAAPAAECGVAAWERRFAETEAEDPAKVGRYPSVKGSAGGQWSDDRTYVCVHRNISPSIACGRGLG